MKAKRFLSALLCAALVFTLLPVTVLAEEPQSALDSSGLSVQASEEPPALFIGVSDVTESGGTVTFTGSADGTVYYAVYGSDEQAPDEAAVLDGEAAAVTAGSTITVTLDGLTAQTGYTVYGLLEDTGGSRSAVASAGFSTAAGPVAANDAGPLAGALTMGVGTTFTADTMEGHTLTYKVLTEDDALKTGTVQVGDGARVIPNTATGSLTIPGTVAAGGITYTITAVADNAFWGCMDLNGVLTIPDSVTSIGTQAFTSCRSLTGTLMLPANLVSIGTGAFSGCKGFTGLTIQNKVTTISAMAFNGCSGLDGTLTIPDSVLTIGDSAFRNCTGLDGLILGAGLRTIAFYAFSGCSGLTGTLIIPGSVIALGLETFKGCAGLSDVRFLGDKPILPASVFDDCAAGFTLQYNTSTNGWSGYTYNGSSSVIVTGLTAPTITGPTTLTLNVGYGATSTDAYTLAGTEPITVEKTTGDAKITWNDGTKKLDIADGLAAGSYPVTLKAGNGVLPDATLTFTLTVGAVWHPAFHVTGATSGYTYDAGVLTFTVPGDYTVSMAEGVALTTDKIVVAGGAKETPVNITLNGVSIDVSSAISGACAFELTGSAAVNLTLASVNNLKSGNGSAGLQVPAGTSLTIGGAGSLTATCTYSDSELSVTGQGAGIGGGGKGNVESPGGGSGEITITGGSVMAESAGGAGIGGGYGYNGGGAGGTITISGGTVTARSTIGAGIGGGGCNAVSTGGSGGSIVISGGTVTARSTIGAGIGGSIAGSGGDVTISGGSVNASGTIYDIQGTPTNGTADVYLTTLTLSGAADKTPVTSLSSTMGYGITGTQTTGSVLYLYLPANTQTTEARTAGAVYTGNVNTGAAGGSGTLYNVRLSGLTISQGALSPVFAGGTYAYTASVGSGVAGFTVTPTVHDANATVTVNGTAVASGSASAPISLSVGKNTVTIAVTAQDGIATATYTLTVTRASGTGGGSSNRSSDDSGSSSHAPVVIQPDKKPDQPVIVGFSVIGAVDGSGHVAVTIPQPSVTDTIAKAKAGAKAQGKTTDGIGIAATLILPDTAKSLGIVLPRATLNSLANAGVKQLKINGVILSLELDMEALKEIQKQSTGDVTITITPAQNLSDEARALIGTRPAYEVTICHIRNGQTVNITSLGKGSTILSIPYAPGRNEAAGYLFGVCIDGSSQASRISGSAYDANSRSVLLGANHFSVYGVGCAAPGLKFTDINRHWTKESIDYVVGRGLLTGTSETAFAPDTAMTRGMLVTALGRLAGVDAKAYTTNSFTDVKTGSSFRPYIEWAYRKGVIQGTGNGKFEPDRAVTREEIAVIFSSYAKAAGYKLPVTREAAVYADASSIGSVYQTAVTAMQQAGIMMGGSGGRFNPKAGATRAETAAMLHRYIKLTIDPATAQGWAQDDAGQWLCYKDGKALTGAQTIDGVKYFFHTDGTLQTGWVKDGDSWRYYSGNNMLVGWWNIGSDSAKKAYYFTKDGRMVSGKWLEIDGKWYYFYPDGALAKNTTVDGCEVDENGVRKSK